MSVCLDELTDGEFDTIEVMAPDYDKEYVWLWQGGKHGTDNRIDISRSQLVLLSKVIDRILT